MINTYNMCRKQKKMEKINKENYYISTRCKFKACRRPRREPDYESDGGSRYWYTDAGVYRESCHWSRIYGVDTDDLWFTNLTECNRVSSCFWILEIHDASRKHITGCGFTPWSGFKYNHKRVGK